ncbi:IS3 family transposase [Brachybacterium sillae]|uniref:IS3 family transposase n=1 Tax=Brachybacterium sillae TaxID=2810536 RepID=UPI00217D8776|nr:IS3 family transposase [Brachybacterium sillae]
MPERTWRRWQAKARTGTAVKGPWPQPARQAARELVVKHALAHPAWGHRKIWAMVRHDGHVVSEATVLRILRDEGLILPAQYQRERRKLAERRKAGVRHRALRPEPSLAAGLQRVRDHHRRDLAAGRVPGLLVQVRAPLPRFAHREPARRDRRDRVGPGRLRGHVRSPAGRGLPGRSRDR